MGTTSSSTSRAAALSTRAAALSTCPITAARQERDAAREALRAAHFRTLQHTLWAFNTVELAPNETSDPITHAPHSNGDIVFAINGVRRFYQRQTLMNLLWHPALGDPFTRTLVSVVSGGAVRLRTHEQHARAEAPALEAAGEAPTSESAAAAMATTDAAVAALATEAAAAAAQINGTAEVPEANAAMCAWLSEHGIDTDSFVHQLQATQSVVSGSTAACMLGRARRPHNNRRAATVRWEPADVDVLVPHAAGLAAWHDWVTAQAAVHGWRRVRYLSGIDPDYRGNRFRQFVSAFAEWQLFAPPVQALATDSADPAEDGARAETEPAQVQQETPRTSAEVLFTDADNDGEQEEGTTARHDNDDARPTIAIQLIVLQPGKSVRDMVQSFDLSCCQAWWDGRMFTTLHSDAQYWWRSPHFEMTAAGLAQSPNEMQRSLVRVEKYMGRGLCLRNVARVRLVCQRMVDVASVNRMRLGPPWTVNRDLLRLLLATSNAARAIALPQTQRRLRRQAAVAGWRAWMHAAAAVPVDMPVHPEPIVSSDPAVVAAVADTPIVNVVV